MSEKTITTPYIEIGKLYRSNNGAGPLVAEIEDVKDNRIILTRWNESGIRKRFNRIKFSLPLDFFFSEKCGWREA